MAGADPGRRRLLRTLTAAVGACLMPKSARGRGPELPPRLRIGAQTNAWGVPIKPYSRLLEIAETLVRLGYQGFETNFASVSSQVGRAADCRRDFESRHIQFIAPHTDGFFYDQGKQANELAKIERLAGPSAQMGASYLIVSGEDLPHPDGKLNLDLVRIKAEALDRLGAAVKKEGLRLCYHNHQSEFLDNPSEMSYLLSETDPGNVRLCLDVGHCFGLIDPAEFSAAHFRRIAIYHLKDETHALGGKIVYTEPGEGKIDLKGIIAPLLNSDWEGWLEIEEEPNYPKPLANPELVLQEWRQYLKELVGV
jgi:sugar phosphate isomerase/epimerase